MIKQGTFGKIQAGLQSRLTKKAADSAIPQTQGVQENGSVPAAKSDAEVNEILPHGASVPTEPAKDLITERGAAVGEKLDGQPSPKEEQKERKETSPSSKLAAARDNLAASIAKVAQGLEAEVKTAAPGVPAGAAAPAAAAPATAAPAAGAAPVAGKTAGSEVPAPGSDDPATVPPIPSGGKSLELGGGNTERNTETPKVEGTQGVTQTDVKGGKPSTDAPQGTKEEGVKLGELSVTDLAQKVARFSNNWQSGYEMGQVLSSLAKQAALAANGEVLPEEERQKIADYNGAVTAQACNELVDLGVQSSIITEKQAAELMKAAGFQPHPLIVAINDFQGKLAQFKAANYTPEATRGYISKVANALGDPAALAAAGAPDPAAGGAPVAGAPAGPAPVGGAETGQSLEQLLQVLDQMIQSGQITEEEAMQLLAEQGVPVDQLLAQGGAGGAGAPAGAPAPGGDPAAAAGIAGAPAGGAPSPGAAEMGAVLGGAPAGDPAAAGVAAPAGPAAGAPPAPGGDAAAAISGGPAGGAPAGGPPAPGGDKPKPEGGGEGGGEKKPEGGKSEGGEKKDDGEKKDKGEGEKKEDKGDDKKKEAAAKKVAFLTKVAGFLKLSNPLEAAVAADPNAAAVGDPAAAAMGGDPAAAMGGDPAAAMGGDPAAAGGAPSLEGLLAEIDALVASGQLQPQEAEQLKAELQAMAAGGGDPGAPAGAPAPAAAPMA